jgi:hypothetical protein
MTLKFSESPALQIKEIDLTGTVPAVTSTTGALVGDFNWGPVGQRVLVGNEAELARVFGNPSSGDANSADFLSASYFLKYSSSLYVVRAHKSGQAYAKDSSDLFTANNPGSLGNEITVSVCSNDEWSSWPHKNSFDSAPDEASEIHVAVVFSGEVVETFDYLSQTAGDIARDGSNNFVIDVINSRSSWVSVAPSATGVTPTDYDLEGGEDASDATVDYASGYDLFKNKDEVQVDFLIAPAGNSTDSMFNHLVAIAQNDRKDCVAVGSLERSDLTNIQAYSSNRTRSSYAVVDANQIRVYDKYQDKYEWIPAASSTAGVMAATDNVSAPWFSPAGSRRGQYVAVTELLINPDKTERDILYKGGANPIISKAGQGIMLFGDKTHLSRPSAFDRINVRRLFLVIERAISQAGQNVMFEFNDEFTRAEFVNIVEPFLREIQGRRGITDFRLVCDETNNTPEVIDRNEFIASCFIKPARSINYVTLNFVAVRTGVEFEEVVGAI